MPLTPKNRKEEWLEGLVEHETTLTPKNRCEAWMKEIIDASGSGGGGGGGALLVYEDDNSTLDKTWNEIATALSTGTIVLLVGSSEYDGSITSAWTLGIGSAYKESASEYNIYFWGNTSAPNYIATSADGYPVANED